ncbi:MAG: photosynthetic complex assembly protein PuhC [Pseudomonadota bacterium]|jgi:putative photosynthetic complex assembly protein
MNAHVQAREARAGLSAGPLLPGGALVAVGIVLAVAVTAVGYARLTGLEVREPDARAVAIRDLRFEDGADGSVVVIDAASGAQVERIAGEQGFLRGALRALARERRMRGQGAAQPFQLIARADGRLTLADPVTGHRIDLESFGPANAGVFARLLLATAPAAGEPATR